MKKTKKNLLITIACLILIFCGYWLSIYIQDQIDEQRAITQFKNVYEDFIYIAEEMAQLEPECAKYIAFPDANSLVKSAEMQKRRISIYKDQPLKQYGITLLWSEKAKEIYLYDPNAFQELWASKYKGFDCVYVASSATKENPKGTYHPHLSVRRPKSEAWIVRTESWIALRSDPVPIIPGCLVSRKKPWHVYFPKEILPALKAYYPNAKIPDELILK